MSIAELSFDDMPVSKELSQDSVPTSAPYEHGAVLAELAENMQIQE